MVGFMARDDQGCHVYTRFSAKKITNYHDACAWFNACNGQTIIISTVLLKLHNPFFGTQSCENVMACILGIPTQPNIQTSKVPTVVFHQLKLNLIISEDFPIAKLPWLPW
jgi:hypothetical protein